MSLGGLSFLVAITMAAALAMLLAHPGEKQKRRGEVMAVAAAAMRSALAQMASLTQLVWLCLVNPRALSLQLCTSGTTKD